MFKKSRLDFLAKVLGTLTILTYVGFALFGLVMIYTMAIDGDPDLVERVTFILCYEIFGFMFFGFIYLVTGTLQKLNQMTCQPTKSTPEETQEE